MSDKTPHRLSVRRLHALSKENLMKQKMFNILAVLAILTSAGVILVQAQGPPPGYQGPVVNIGRHHGQLREAQGYLVQAYHSIENAQQNNDGQLGGHAQRAKDLINQADAELRQAANVSNQEGR
jgi:hypothetical protein